MLDWFQRERARFPQRLSFFYGWVMLGVAMVTHVATSPGQTFAISIFYPSFSRELALSPTAITSAYGIATLLGSLPTAWIGSLSDRHGIRKVMLGVLLLFTTACLGASGVRGWWSLAVAFLFLRMLGQGALTLLANNTLPMWFNKKLGSVHGLKAAVMAGAIALTPLCVESLIKSVGWRQSYVVLGLVVCAVTLPAVLFFFHDRPESIGQLQDGDIVGSETTASLDLEARFTLSEALRTRSFWILGAISVALGLVTTGVFFNIVPLCVWRGLEPSAAAGLYATFAVGLAIMQLMGGFLADRFRLNLLLALAAAGYGAAVLSLSSVGSTLGAHLFAAGFGVSLGLSGVASTTSYARYFGRASLGKIRGAVWSATVAGSSLGPVALGAGYEHLGSYAPTLWTFSGTFVVLALAALFATRPPAAEVRGGQDAQ